MEVSVEREISLDEVASHNTADDFWIVMNNKVYDLSGFHKIHPGGDLILCAAGSDGTVLFEHYHFTRLDEAKRMLKGKCIGSLVGSESPIMGKFYEDVAAKARLALQDLPRRPLLAGVLFFLDVACIISLVAFGLYLMQLNTVSPALQFIVPVALSICSSRVSAHSHAVGHLQVFDKKWARFGELIMSMFGARTMPPYALPVATVTYRTLLHKPRRLAQLEYSSMRGPFEHQALHHVKGADLEYDACKFVASLAGIIRVHDREPLRWHHVWQANYICRNLSFAVAILGFDLAAPLLKLSHCRLTFRVHQWMDAAAALFGAIFDVALVTICWILPWGNVGVLAFVVACRMSTTFLLLFYCQHVWSSSLTEELANKDWGKYNTETSISVIGENMTWHPLLWGYTGNTPSTLTYHIEHTLFPGVNYLYLSILSPIVQESCKKYGITYHALRSFGDMNRLYAENSIHFSRETKRKCN